MAPLLWVEANLRHLIDGGMEPSKVLLGLNWYGYDRSGGRMDAILGKRYVPSCPIRGYNALKFSFYELLSEPYSELEWDEEAKEHRIRWGYVTELPERHSNRAPALEIMESPTSRRPNPSVCA